MAVERTLSIIKPDAVAKNVIGQIISRFEEAGLTVVAAKMLHLSDNLAGGFYAEHKERPFYPDLVKFMTSGPVVVQVIAPQKGSDRRCVAIAHPYTHPLRTRASGPNSSWHPRALQSRRSGCRRLIWAKARGRDCCTRGKIAPVEEGVPACCRSCVGIHVVVADLRFTAKGLKVQVGVVSVGSEVVATVATERQIVCDGGVSVGRRHKLTKAQACGVVDFNVCWQTC